MLVYLNQKFKVHVDCSMTFFGLKILIREISPGLLSNNVQYTIPTLIAVKY